MSAPAIIAQLKAAGIRISRRGDNLLAEPRVAVTEPLLNLIRTHKGELLAALPDQRASVATATPTTAPDQHDSPGVDIANQEFELLLKAVGPAYDTPAEQYAVIRAAAARDMAAALESYWAMAERHGLTIH